MQVGAKLKYADWQTSSRCRVIVTTGSTIVASFKGTFTFRAFEYHLNIIFHLTETIDSDANLMEFRHNNINKLIRSLDHKYITRICL